MAVLQLQVKDKKTNKLRNAGKIEIRNQTTESANLYFYGDIASESWQSEWYKDDMCPTDVKEFLEQLEGVSTINVHINSGGGSVFGGLAIGHQLKRYPAETVGYMDGIAASIAGVLLMFCDRIIAPENAMFMMHKPSNSCVGNANNMRKQAEVLDQCQTAILGIFMEKAKEGVTEETINKMINEETWLTGKKLEQYFNIEVEKSVQAVASCTSDYFDKYTNIPENLKPKEEENAIDKITKQLENITNVLQKTVMQQETSKPEETKPEDNLEKLKEEILEDLDLL